MKKPLRVYLASLDLEVPVHKHLRATSQVIVLTADIPEKIRRNAGLGGKTATYWYGENAGGNRLISGDEKTEEEKKAEEFVENVARNLEQLASGVRAIVGGRLSKRAVVLLLASASGVSQELTTKVINALAEIDKTFVKEK